MAPSFDNDYLASDDLSRVFEMSLQSNGDTIMRDAGLGADIEEQDARREVDRLDAEVQALEADMEVFKAKLAAKKEEQKCWKDTLKRFTAAKRGGYNVQHQYRPHRGNEELINYDAEDFDWVKPMRATMKKVFRIPDFRLCQRAVCNAVMDGRDIFCIMPTGGGKSLTYQLPALFGKGVTIVISPLISLITDQVLQLQELGVEAVKLSSSNSGAETKAIERRLHELAAGTLRPGEKEIKLCYVTPEKVLQSKKFQSLLQKLADSDTLDRIVLDEAHCVSQLGHDFRPDYGKLHILRRDFPHVPIMAVSATCPQVVMQDVLRILLLKPLTSGMAASRTGTVHFTSPLYRANLHYSILPKAVGAGDQYQAIVDYILINHKHDSGIIYCHSRKDTEEVAREIAVLSDYQIKTGVYHSDRNDTEKDTLHRSWRSGEIKVVCATIAFGLGIDKGNVRFVIHHTISKSLDTYYQESGRAGRDGKDSDCVLFYSPSDYSALSALTASDKDSQAKLLPMLDFAQNLQECRKVQFARYFSASSDLSLSAWTSDATDALARCGHCDNCTRSEEGVMRVDMTLNVWKIVKVSSYVKEAGGKLTLRQLATLVRGNGKGVFEIAGRGNKKTSGQLDLQTLIDGPVGIDKDNIERVIVQLIIDGFLGPLYHRNNYTTVVYLMPGLKATRLLRHTKDSLAAIQVGQRIQYTLPAKSKGKGKSKAQSKADKTAHLEESCSEQEARPRRGLDNFVIRGASNQNVGSSSRASNVAPSNSLLAVGKENASEERSRPRSKKRAVRPVVASDEDEDHTPDSGDAVWSHTMRRDIPDTPLKKKRKSTTRSSASRATEEEVIELTD